LNKHIIPKLYRFGLIHRTREFPKNGKWTIKSKRKSREHESLQFSSFLRKIADEWEAIAHNARVRRKHEDQKQREKENEIQKQERLEWGKIPARERRHTLLNVYSPDEILDGYFLAGYSKKQAQNLLPIPLADSCV